MSKNNNRLSRRELAKRLGIVAGAGLASAAYARVAPVTPAQVEGPFHPVEVQADMDVDLTLLEGHTEVATGEVILVQGRVLDAAGQPLSNALVDVWQANHHGRYSHEKDPNTAPLDPNFQGWAIQRTNAAGEFAFKTIKPGAYPLSFLGEEGWRCRHIHFKVVRDGYADITTQMYFQGDPLIEQDQEIAKAPSELRHTLIASSVKDEVSGLPKYEFDVVLGLA
jgi:protocatechuate 3,4-dioxygenase beta subunit